MYVVFGNKTPHSTTCLTLLCVVQMIQTTGMLLLEEKETRVTENVYSNLKEGGEGVLVTTRFWKK